MVDVGHAVQWRGRQAEPLGAARHGRVVDRLHIDLELVEEPIGDVPAQYWVANHDRDDMARIVEVRDLGGIEPAAQQPDILVQPVAFEGAALQVTDAGKGGPATAGGNADVKMKPEAKLRTKSHSAAEPAI